MPPTRAAAAAGVVAATLCLATTRAGAVELTVPVDLATGAYRIVLDGTTWLSSGVYSATSGGKSLTSANGGLSLTRAVATSGEGRFGAYTGASLTWSVGGLAGGLVCNIYTYAAPGVVVFEQVFPLGLNGTALPGAGAADDLTAAFPTFGPALPALNSSLAFLTYHDVTIKSAVGRWTSSSVDAALFGAYGGPVALFDAAGAAVVMSPASDFMVSHAAFAPSLGQAFGLGMGGAVERIPAGWTHQSVLAAGPSLNDTFVALGDCLLALGHKNRTAPDADLHTSHLSYWADKCVRGGGPRAGVCARGARRARAREQRAHTRPPRGSPATARGRPP